MDLTKFEIRALHQETNCSKVDKLSANAFVSVNINSLIGQALFSWESENSSSACYSPSATVPVSEGNKFLSEGRLLPNPFLKFPDIARDNLISVDAIKIKGEREDCGIMRLEKRNEHSNDVSLFSVKIPTSDLFDSLGNSVANQFNNCKQITNAENASNNASTDSTQGNTILSNFRMYESQKELNTRNQRPNSRDVGGISEKENLRTDSVKVVQSLVSLRNEEDRQPLGFDERGSNEQSNSLRRSQSEAAPGWKKPPRPPRSTKHEANSIHKKQISNSCKAKKLETLHGRKKMKAEGRSPNLTLFFAILFTFCFCLLIASSSK